VDGESFYDGKGRLYDLERTGFSRIWVEGDSVYKTIVKDRVFQTGDER